MKALHAAALSWLLALACGSASAADEVVYTGSVSLPALMDRAPALTGPRRPDASALLDPAGELPPACLQAAAGNTALQPLLDRLARTAQRLTIAEHFFAVLAIEDDENMGTERVAASYNLLTHLRPGAPAEERLARELAWQQALSQRNELRLAHHLARLRLGLASGAAGANSEALVTESMGWPQAPAGDFAKLVREALAGNPQLQALTLLHSQPGRLPAGCATRLEQQISRLREALTLSAQQLHGQLELALDSRRTAARLQLELAEMRLDQVRAAESRENDLAILHVAQINAGAAAAALQRVRDESVLASLRLQALMGLPLTVPAK